MKNNSKTSFTAREISLYGLFIALVFVATKFINFPGPMPGQLFHLGNIMAFTIAIVFGRKAGAISAAFGMALFDLTSPYAIWAPFTFIIRLSMGFVIGTLALKGIETESKLKSVLYNFIGILIASIIMLGGYFIANIILFNNVAGAIASFPADSLQCAVGAVVALPLGSYLKLEFKRRKVAIEI